MSARRFYLSFRSFNLVSTAPCFRCQQRTFTASYRIRAAEATGRAPAPPKQFTHRLPETRGTEDFVPQPLGRPIGFREPPTAGENTGKDDRSLGKRREDFVNYDNHMKKRKDLQKQLYRPYFMDFRNMKYENGKAFLGNAKLFKGAASLYFPNFHVTTLESSSPADTTPVLGGKISVVNVFSSQWAQDQIDTFVGPQQNPAVQEILDTYSTMAQRVDINVEENWLKQAVLWTFKPNLRRATPEERHGKYFVVTNGISQEIRETIGLINSKVGFVYLLDAQCRIRWAACADASNMEKDTLARGLKRLIEEHKEEQKGKP